MTSVLPIFSEIHIPGQIDARNDRRGHRNTFPLGQVRSLVVQSLKTANVSQASLRRSRRDSRPTIQETIPNSGYRIWSIKSWAALSNQICSKLHLPTSVTLSGCFYLYGILLFPSDFSGWKIRTDFPVEFWTGCLGDMFSSFEICFYLHTPLFFYDTMLPSAQSLVFFFPPFVRPQLGYFCYSSSLERDEHTTATL